MRWLAAFLLSAALFAGDPPVDVLRFFGSLTDALGLAHERRSAQDFLDHFDHAMPGFEKLRDQIEPLAVEDEITSTIDPVSDSGDDQKRVLELDWLLQAGTSRPHRAIVKCTIEKRGKTWKITALDPVEFFVR